MKKYIVPNDSGDGWKLLASRSVPSHAMCEAPDNYTREMEPFIRVSTIKDGGVMRVIPSLDPGWSKRVRESSDVQLKADLKRMQEVAEQMKKAEEREKFNQLNPAQRYVKSILGEVAEASKPIVFRWAMKQLFGDKIP